MPPPPPNSSSKIISTINRSTCFLQRTSNCSIATSCAAHRYQVIGRPLKAVSYLTYTRQTFSGAGWKSLTEHSTAPSVLDRRIATMLQQIDQAIVADQVH